MGKMPSFRAGARVYKGLPEQDFFDGRWGSATNQYRTTVVVVERGAEDQNQKHGGLAADLVFCELQERACSRRALTMMREI